MGIDIRLPIGLMFSLFGLLLTAFGLLSERAIYTRSLGINVNLGWGIVLLVFGAAMFLFGRRGSASIKRQDGKVEPRATTTRSRG